MIQFVETTFLPIAAMVGITIALAFFAALLIAMIIALKE